MKKIIHFPNPIKNMAILSLFLLASLLPIKTNAQGNSNSSDQIRPGIVTEIIAINNNAINSKMEIAMIEDLNGEKFRTTPIPKGLLTAGETIEIHQKSIAGNNGNGQGPDQFIVLCAFGGPVIFGGCLLVALILVSASAY